MNSLGVIETRGLVAAIQAVDAACKAAGVTCIGYRKVGSGLVTVCFDGEISAVYTAIERGIAVASATDHQARNLMQSCRQLQKWLSARKPLKFLQILKLQCLYLRKKCKPPSWK
ncbi:TPA: BMC domain-containing protein [Escherichia coli]